MPQSPGGGNNRCATARQNQQPIGGEKQPAAAATPPPPTWEERAPLCRTTLCMCVPRCKIRGWLIRFPASRSNDGCSCAGLGYDSLAAAVPSPSPASVHKASSGRRLSMPAALKMASRIFPPKEVWRQASSSLEHDWCWFLPPVAHSHTPKTPLGASQKRVAAAT